MVREQFTILRHWRMIKQYKDGFYGMSVDQLGNMFLRCQSSVMYIPEGVTKKITNKEVDYWRGDQDWIGAEFQKLDFYPDSYWDTMRRHKKKEPEKELIILGNSIKNHIAVDTIPWVKKYWT